MAFTLGAAVTGATVSGFTTPTYTFSADTAPDVNGKQFYVSALGGTQAGVTTHSSSDPFTTCLWKPKVIKTIGPVVPNTGRVSRVPKNVYKLVTRKGVTPLSGQPKETMIITTIIELPAGSDVADAPNLKGAVSAHFGALNNQSSGIADSVMTNAF